MRHLQLIFIFLLLLTLPMSVNSEETGVLYLWEISSSNVWESFGDETSHQKYKGMISNGKPHGKGSLSYPDGKSVTGEWRDGKEWNTKHYDKDGKVFGKSVNGEWRRSWGFLFLRKVSGKWGWHEDGDTGKDYKYEGMIENGKPNGSGTYTSPSGNQYVGEFKGGIKHGQGTFIYASGSKYQGEWKNGKKHGQGTFISPNGNKYVGQWKNGKKHAQGTFTYASGSKYQGDFKDDKKHGKGTFTWKNGAKRVGEFRKGKLWNVTEYDKNENILRKWVNGVKVVEKKKEKHLFLRKENGKLYWFESGYEDNDGEYVGSIDKNKIPNGAGTLIFSDGNKYEGEWKDGEINGRGTYTYYDGNQYIGEFKKWKKHGQGTYTWSDGNKYEGEWKDGEINGRGTYTYYDGNQYIGEFKKWKKHGQGTYTWSDGKKYEGEWKDGETKRSWYCHFTRWEVCKGMEGE